MSAELLHAADLLVKLHELSMPISEEGRVREVFMLQGFNLKPEALNKQVL